MVAGEGDGAGFVVEVEAVRGPGPVFGCFAEAARDRVAVHVAQLLDALVVGEDVEVVVTAQPEGAFDEAARDGYLQGLEGGP